VEGRGAERWGFWPGRVGREEIYKKRKWTKMTTPIHNPEKREERECRKQFLTRKKLKWLKD